MEIVIKGSGETVVRFIDRKGRTLLQESIRVYGSEKVETKRDVNLFVETLEGDVLVSPVLIRQSQKQQVTFAGEQPASYTKKRCQEIGCTQSIVEDAERGCAQGLQAGTIRLSSTSIQGKDSRGT
jgi:hypothetical protein